jgi:imidazolonepropionase-like amidohydrolase
VGTVQPGKVADLIVVDGNPLTDLSILTDPSGLCLVVQDGTVIVRRRELAHDSAAEFPREG